ncbi:hypothetical protein DPMN_167705 [Dreissena polymorpha]|uniref:Uncharacterized protein n=1 Tax=Dreissena polymorpha TaxID=45954 RepID=A0A9D4F4B4_DREPO|nr:hypothetical protein DPMN_167705 [Dreissena polymorpha]
MRPYCALVDNLKDKILSGRSSQGSAARCSAFMARLEVTGRCLHPRDSYPSTLSVLSTAIPGSLYRATPLMF